MTPTVILVSFLTVLVGCVTSLPSLKTSSTTVSYNVTYTQTSLRSVRAKISPTKVSKLSKTLQPTQETSNGPKPTTKSSKPTEKPLKTTTAKPTSKTTPKTTPVSFRTEDLNENIDKSVERRVWHPKDSEEPPVFGKKCNSSLFYFILFYQHTLQNCISV